MLPLLSILLFAWIGFAALTVDAGLAFTSQSRLEAAAQTLVLERDHFVAREQAANRDPDAEGAWDTHSRALLEDVLGRVNFDPEASAFETVAIETDTEATGVPAQVTLGARTHLLFGMAALLPTQRDADGTVQGALSLSELNARRASGDLLPQLDSGGLRGRGFEPRAVGALASAPIARVGAADAALGIPGLAPVALSGAGLQGLPATLDADGALISEDGSLVGCAIDARRTASLGRFALRPRGNTTLGDAPLAYAPILDGLSDCGAGDRTVVGFLAVQIAAGSVARAPVTGRLVNASTIPERGTLPFLAPEDSGRLAGLALVEAAP